MKLNATQGILLATAILAVIGGAMSYVANYVNTQDISALGTYGIYLKAFLNGFPVIIFATWIYNVFMYLYQNRKSALQKAMEQYDTTKLVQTLSFFIAIIGPITTFSPQFKEIGALIVVILTALIKEFTKVFGGDTPTPPVTVAAQTSIQSPSTTPEQTDPAVSQNMRLQDYNNWEVTVENWRLTMYPPANLISRWGQSMSLGSVQGWTTSAAYTKATQYIDQLLATPEPDPSKKLIPPA